MVGEMDEGTALTPRTPAIGKCLIRERTRSRQEQVSWFPSYESFSDLNVELNLSRAVV
jgi:hypothetical protein